MKKKFLSLMMAAAVVATTSVSAFAADETTDVTVGKNGVEQDVEITGNIADSNDHVVEGTITVTVPTAMAFTINSSGDLENGKITITNKSDSKVEVIAKGFEDSTPASGIIVKKNSELTNLNEQDEKRNIALTLKGQKSVGLLSSGNTGSGLYNVDTDSEVPKDGTASLGVILPKRDLELKLIGKVEKTSGGEYKAPTEAIQDSFTLKLKIKKTN